MSEEDSCAKTEIAGPKSLSWKGWHDNEGREEGGEIRGVCRFGSHGALQAMERTLTLNWGVWDIVGGF